MRGRCVKLRGRRKWRNLKSMVVPLLQMEESESEKGNMWKGLQIQLTSIKPPRQELCKYKSKKTNSKVQIHKHKNSIKPPRQELGKGSFHAWSAGPEKINSQKYFTVGWSKLYCLVLNSFFWNKGPWRSHFYKMFICFNQHTSLKMQIKVALPWKSDTDNLDALLLDNLPSLVFRFLGSFLSGSLVQYFLEVLWQSKQANWPPLENMRIIMGNKGAKGHICTLKLCCW